MKGRKHCKIHGFGFIKARLQTWWKLHGFALGVSKMQGVCLTKMHCATLHMVLAWTESLSNTRFWPLQALQRDGTLVLACGRSGWGQMWNAWFFYEGPKTMRNPVVLAVSRTPCGRACETKSQRPKAKIPKPKAKIPKPKSQKPKYQMLTADGWLALALQLTADGFGFGFTADSWWLTDCFAELGGVRGGENRLVPKWCKMM